MPLAVSSTNEEKLTITANPVTAAGNPATLDGPLRVTVISGDATVEQDAATPNSFTVISSNNPGDTTVLVEGDADLGAGVVLIQDTVVYSVIGAQAAVFGLSASAPVMK